MRLNKLLHATKVFGLYRKPWLRFADYAGLLTNGQKYRVELRNGLTVEVRARVNDFEIVDEIFIHQVYQQALERVRQGSVVIDIGAQCGVFTLAAALRGARVIAYEPLPDNYELLVANIRHNGFDAVSANKLAVSARTGETDFYVVPQQTGWGTVHPECHGWSAERPGLRKMQVECLSLDDVFRQNQNQRCDLLKMDCEGSEYDILSAASQQTLSAIDAIILEYHLNVNVEALTGLLCAGGFQVERLWRYGYLFACRDARA